MKTLLRITAAAALAATAACGLVDPPGTPLVEAHRGAAGNWPENSRMAIVESVAAGYPAIEFDLALTKDLIPVLSHYGWMDRELCTYTDGTPLPEGRTYIQDYTLAELQEQFRCGGIRDPEQPDAVLFADTHMTLDELHDLVRPHPQMVLHYDIKYEPGATPPVDDFIREIFGRYDSAGLENPFYATSTEADFTAAAVALNIPMSMTWPKFEEGKSDVLTAVGAELLAQLGLRDPIALARQAGATGLNMPYQVVDRRVVEAAKAEGMSVQIWTINDADVLAAYCRWPVDAVITDYPERAPCL